ncbi:gamma-glutamylcyclotransferase [Jannaschia sp. S6380]|uniref:gamma-glutamylcyclotransferase n=1 Tax=Jannaschia sp. S6380 TaxID=2926408 RepID=UPI001FF157D0|nr:gamma-glutamylcyclotransferase [Jannaschia sp. S6380]MCK0169107.1 gamma-glutamylcyclotransferase [Jannaschia sp. S6380]
MIPRFFGYGSLVNRRTHAYPGAERITVTGWRRAWRHTPLRPVAFLTAVPDAGARIDGLTAEVPGGDWAALDLREAAYIRAALPDGAQVYHIPDGHHGPATDAHPILLSYLDVVVQGYLAEFGTDGVARFFETTDGWNAPIRDDRDDPAYPRAQTLTAAETALVDDWLSRVRPRA